MANKHTGKSIAAALSAIQAARENWDEGVLGADAIIVAASAVKVKHV